MEFSNQVPDGNVNVTHESPLKELTFLLGGLLLVAGGLYLALGFLVDAAVDHLSPAQEKALSFDFDLPEKSVGRVEVTQKLQTLVDEMQTSCIQLPLKIKVHVVNEDMVNAVALPGGIILVYQGLLDKVKSENELAFVLGHELGHFKNRDHLKGMGRGIVILVFSILLFGPNNSLGDLVLQSVNTVEMSFSRKQESKADAVGLGILNCHYQHVGGSTEFFEMLSKEQGDVGELGHFFSTHPVNSKRIQDINALAEKSGYTKKALLPKIDG